MSKWSDVSTRGMLLQLASAIKIRIYITGSRHDIPEILFILALEIITYSFNATNLMLMSNL